MLPGPFQGDEKEHNRMDFEVNLVAFKRIVRRGPDLTSNVTFYDGDVRDFEGSFYLGEWGQERTFGNGLMSNFSDVAEAIEKIVVKGTETVADPRRFADLRVHYESDPEKYLLHSGRRGSTQREGSYLLRVLNDTEMEELILMTDSRLKKLYPENF